MQEPELQGGRCHQPTIMPQVDDDISLCNNQRRLNAMVPGHSVTLKNPIDLLAVLVIVIHHQTVEGADGYGSA